MNRPALHKLRFWLLLVAFGLVIGGLVLPRVKLTRDAYDVMAFVDITSSMNTRDLTLHGKPAGRLDVVKDRLHSFVTSLPCQSKFGLGIFTARRVFVLFEPVEVCENFASIDASITGLDWRMGWEGDSYITRGVHDAVPVALGLDTDLLFFTDGHEAPPLPWTGMQPFEGTPGEVVGLLVGVGGKSLVPIPKFDDEGNENGVLGQDEVLQENRSGVPPPDASSRPGWHPKWAPFGDVAVNRNEHLTSVKEDHLKTLASQTGLAYAYLTGANALREDFTTVARPRQVVVATDIRPYPAGLALLLLLILYGALPLRDHLAAWRTRDARPAGSRTPSVKLKEAHP
jgi:mxaL protein